MICVLFMCFDTIYNFLCRVAGLIFFVQLFYSAHFRAVFWWSDSISTSACLVYCQLLSLIFNVQNSSMNDIIFKVAYFCISHTDVHFLCCGFLTCYVNNYDFIPPFVCARDFPLAIRYAYHLSYLYPYISTTIIHEFLNLNQPSSTVQNQILAVDLYH
jgi:hypothetical protein